MTRYNKGKNTERVALLDDYESDDDFFLKGPSSASDKVKRVQSQVNEVVDVMQTNIGKVLERGDKLEDLQDKSESLADSATHFNTHATRLRKQMWWKDMRTKIVIGVLLLMILIIIIVSIAVKNKGS
ncbi:vesicle-associated membrane protein 4-like [Ciona intestinalis]